MSLELKVPGIGESIQEATVGLWKKAEGDYVSVDEPLVEIESEKATLEVPAPAAGVLKKILRKPGAAKGGKTSNGEKTKSPAPAAVASTAPTSPASAAAAVDTSSVRGGPAARRMMAETGLSADEIKGSGRGGRIQTQDVVRALDERKSPEPQMARATLPAAVVVGLVRFVSLSSLRLSFV